MANQMVSLLDMMTIKDSSRYTGQPLFTAGVQHMIRPKALMGRIISVLFDERSCLFWSPFSQDKTGNLTIFELLAKP